MKIHKILVIQIFQALRDIFEQNYHADKVIERYLKSNKKWGARDRRFFAENTYDLVRWWRKLWTLVGQEPSFDEPSLEKLWQVKLNFEIKKTNLPPAIDHSIPDWIYNLGREELGEKWDEILASLNQQAPVVLRANSLKTTPEKLKQILETEDVFTKLLPQYTDALELIERKNVFQTQAFKNGLFEMQDASSQLVAAMLQPESSMRVIDACAGAGGKTLHIAALMKNTGKIIALDTAANKLEELKKRTRRAGVDIVEVREITSTKIIKRLHDTADRLLLDVPCSGLGVLRRNPDTKWKLTKARLDELRQIQANILDQYSPMVKAGGLMVYSTCSILKSENSEQIKGFLKRNNQWQLLDEKPIYPHESGYDGFYISLLKKSVSV